MNNTKVSIIVPCYNQAQFLDETLKSVLSQTYSNWECIIVNDGSTDNTEVVARRWTNKDSRFAYILKLNGGLSSARNTGLRIAKGAYIQFLDSDDILGVKKLETSVDLSNQNNADIIISDFKRFRKTIFKLKAAYCDLSKQEFSIESILLKWDSEFTIPIHCGFFKKSLIDNILFNEELKAKEDWKFWIDVFKKKPKVSYINQELVFYRMHKKGMTRNRSHMNENLRLAYITIYESLDVKNKSTFISKIIKDGSQSKESYFEKYVKYKKLFYYSLAIISLLTAVAIFLSFKLA